MNHTELATAVFNKYASDYECKFMDLSMYHESFDVFCAQIPHEDAEILDIACGPGNISRYLLQKRPGFRILGIDLARNMLERARINNPQAEYRLMDCRDIVALDKQYVGIMCGFCLPYLAGEDVVKLIADARQILIAGGALYLSTMEDDPSRSGFRSSSQDENDRCYLYYHEAGFLQNALFENGFDIVHLQRKVYPSKGGNQTTDLLIVAVKMMCS